MPSIPGLTKVPKQKEFSKKISINNEKSYLTKNSEISLLNLELDNIENKSNKKKIK